MNKEFCIRDDIKSGSKLFFAGRNLVFFYLCAYTYLSIIYSLHTSKNDLRWLIVKPI